MTLFVCVCIPPQSVKVQDALSILDRSQDLHSKLSFRIAGGTMGTKEFGAILGSSRELFAARTAMRSSLSLRGDMGPGSPRRGTGLSAAVDTDNRQGEVDAGLLDDDGPPEDAPDEDYSDEHEEEEEEVDDE